MTPDEQQQHERRPESNSANELRRTDSADELEEIEPVDFESMSADDWEEYLEAHPDRALQVTDPKGTHEFSYDPDEDYVVFWAFGSAGYDRQGSRAALEEVAGKSSVVLVGYEEAENV